MLAKREEGERETMKGEGEEELGTKEEKEEDGEEGD